MKWSDWEKVIAPSLLPKLAVLPEERGGERAAQTSPATSPGYGRLICLGPEVPLIITPVEQTVSARSCTVCGGLIHLLSTCSKSKSTELLQKSIRKKKKEISLKGPSYLQQSPTDDCTWSAWSDPRQPQPRRLILIRCLV